MASEENFPPELVPIADRIRLALVTVLMDEDTLSIGSGVLVALGGVEFVLTAGHNPWNKGEGRRNKLSVAQAMPPFAFILKPGDGSVADVRMGPIGPKGDPEPDVAVLELGADAKMRPARRPFEEAEIGFFANESPARRLLLAGIPSDEVVPQPAAKRRLTKLPPFDGKAIVYDVPTNPGYRAREEPLGGRGVHVLIEFAGTSVKSPRGLSGGPLVVPAGDGLLVGLARSKEDVDAGVFDEWCEPVVEAVKLLLYHPNVMVASAAQRIVARASS
ncbi:MAG: hypothetical protein ACRELB_25185 [Polyangiaceae bacterium]